MEQFKKITDKKYLYLYKGTYFAIDELSRRHECVVNKSTLTQRLFQIRENKAISFLTVESCLESCSLSSKDNFISENTDDIFSLLNRLWV